jgi:hypothetical protein
MGPCRVGQEMRDLSPPPVARWRNLNWKRRSRVSSPKSVPRTPGAADFYFPEEPFRRAASHEKETARFDGGGA